MLPQISLDHRPSTASYNSIAAAVQRSYKETTEAPNTALVTVASLSKCLEARHVERSQHAGLFGEGERMLHSQGTREINRVEKMHPCGDGGSKKKKNYCKPMWAGGGGRSYSMPPHQNPKSKFSPSFCSFTTTASSRRVREVDGGKLFYIFRSMSVVLLRVRSSALWVMLFLFFSQSALTFSWLVGLLNEWM